MSRGDGALYFGRSGKNSRFGVETSGTGNDGATVVGVTELSIRASAWNCSIRLLRVGVCVYSVAPVALSEDGTATAVWKNGATGRNPSMKTEVMGLLYAPCPIAALDLTELIRFGKLHPRNRIFSFELYLVDN